MCSSVSRSLRLTSTGSGKSNSIPSELAHSNTGATAPSRSRITPVYTCITAFSRADLAPQRRGYVDYVADPIEIRACLPESRKTRKITVYQADAGPDGPRLRRPAIEELIARWDLPGSDRRTAPRPGYGSPRASGGPVVPHLVPARDLITSRLLRQVERLVRLVYELVDALGAVLERGNAEARGDLERGLRFQLVSD